MSIDHQQYGSGAADWTYMAHSPDSDVVMIANEIQFHFNVIIIIFAQKITLLHTEFWCLEYTALIDDKFEKK